MPTKKPHFSIILEPEMLQRVLEYKEKNKISSQSKAIQRLIEIGIRDTSPAPVLAPDEARLVSDYRELNSEGKEYIRHTMALTLNAHSGKDGVVSDLESTL